MKERIQKKGNSNQKEKGITLIALVVTIIILLILAGVAIGTITGDNGLFRKAREATNMYKDAERDESTALETAKGEIDKILSGGYARGNTKVTVSDGSYYIPDGFKLAEDSGKTINEGIVVEDKNGNQWVWIPCYVNGGVGSDVANAVKYDRYAFSNPASYWRQIKLTKEDGTPDLDTDGSQKIINANNDSYYYHETINSNDQSSISQFGGYYIGRYEAGDKESTMTKVMRGEEGSTINTNENEGDTNHTVTIKKGQAPYNYVTQEQCVTLSNGFANANNYDTSKMYTKLCSSYAWDTALMFIGGEYATNSPQGNYADIEFTYTDLTGIVKTKKEGWYDSRFGEVVDGTLIPTGQTTAVKNMYDMGGNIWEYTSELCNSNNPALRGGVYYTGSERSAGGREFLDSLANNLAGFRPTLYLKTININN